MHGKADSCYSALLKGNYFTSQSHSELRRSAWDAPRFRICVRIILRGRGGTAIWEFVESLCIEVVYTWPGRPRSYVCHTSQQWLMAMWMRPHRWRGPTFGSRSSSAHADRGVNGAAVDEVVDPRLRENECWGDVLFRISLLSCRRQ